LPFGGHQSYTIRNILSIT